MQERARAKRGFHCGRSRKIDPASCILLGSQLSPLLSRSLFALGDVETPHEEPPVRDYEIALPLSRGVFNLVYYRLRLSLPPLPLSLCRAQGTNFTVTFFTGDLSFEARKIYRRQASVLIRSELFVEMRNVPRRLAKTMKNV